VPQCTAKSKRSGARCKRHAVAGYTVCYMHGANPKAKGGAPKGAKNARKHGGYESLVYSVLTDNEKTAWERIDTDISGQIDEQIKLASIREYRLLSRIAELSETDVVKIQETYAAGIDRNAETDLTTTVSEAALPMILKIEEALTRVQSQKARLIDLKHKLHEQADSQGAKAILELVGAIRKQAPDDDE
jgi:uncharacterized protein YjcR